VLNETGSLAGIAGLMVSLAGFGIALLQISRLRGETRAAKEAAEEALNLFQRDLANTDVARLRERIQRLMELHRERDRNRVLDHYREIWERFLSIRLRLSNLPEDQRREIQRAVEAITEMQRQVEGLDSDRIPIEMYLAFNDQLLSLQTILLPTLEEEIEKARPER
jgi:hypothetical protein